MKNIFKNMPNSSKYAEKLYNFILENKNIILISFFVALVINAVDIFTIKFGIDSEAYAIADSSKMYNDIQRYGSWLLYYLIPFARYHIVSQIIGIFALTLAALLTISRHNLPNSAKLLFVLLFVTYPNFAFLQYFYFQSAYNFIGLLLVVIAYRLIEKNNMLLYILAIVFLFIGISSYQSNIAVFLSVMMINIILDYIDNKNIRISIINIIKPTIMLIISVLIYYIIIKVVNRGLNGYHGQFTEYYKNGIIEGLGNVFKNIWQILFSNGVHGSHTANIMITVILIIYILYSIINYKKYKENIKLSFLILLWLLSIFSINIAFGTTVPIRAELTFAFYPAFILMLIFYFNNKLKYLVIILTVFIIGFHASNIVKYQMCYYLTFKQNEALAHDIISKIYNKYPEITSGKYKIRFTGMVSFGKHPLIKGREFFSWSFFGSGNDDNYRRLDFLKLQGFPMNIQIGNMTDDMMKKVKDMPSYPDNDCVKLIDNTVIIKLSN